MNEITYEERAKVYGRAFRINGVAVQLIVALEELSECQKEICKILRKNGDMVHLAEEIADATICLEQMKMAFNLDDSVGRFMDAKIRRLNSDLKKAAHRGKGGGV